MSCIRLAQDNLAATKRPSPGQGLVEFALILPILLFLIMGIIDFGRALFTYSQASNGLRDSLRYGAATGFDPTAPQYAECGLMESMAEDSVYFASNAVATATYTLSGAPVTCTAFSADPSLYTIENGDQITIELTVTTNLITPILNSMFPSLTFTVGGTRTLATDITFGEGVPALGTISDVYVFCSNPDFLYMEWPSDTTGTVDWYQVFRDDSTDPIGEIDEADADQYDGTVGGLSGCTGLPGIVGSCHDFNTDFGSPAPHRYYVQACSASLGCSPTTEAVGGPLSCPEQTTTPAQPTINTSDSVCGFGEHFVQLKWSYPGDPIADQIVEYRIYKGTPPGTQVRVVAAPATSCSDCDPGWDGSGPQNYYVVAFNGLESSPSAGVPISACTGFSELYLQDTTIAGDGGGVPALLTESNAMNLNCGAGGVAYNMRKDENHYWFSRPFPDVYTMPVGTYNLTVDVTTPASKNMWYDITLSVCRAASGFGTCDLVAEAQDVLFSDTSLPGEQSVPLGGVGTPTAQVGDRLRLDLVYDTSDPYGATINIGVQGACGGSADSRVAFP